MIKRNRRIARTGLAALVVIGVPGVAGLSGVSGLAACSSSSSTTQPDSSAPSPDASSPAPDGGTDSSAQDAGVGAATCTIAAPAPPDWRLVADGTNLRDGLGRVVFLRGVDSGERSKFAPYVPFDYPDGGYAASLASYMDHPAGWGMNVIRLAFTWAALEPTQGANDSDWLARYDQLIDAAWARGIWTVIDFHQDIYSEVFCGDGFPAWTVPDAGPPAHDCPNWSLSYFSNPGVASAFDRFWEAGSPVQTAYGAAWDLMVARYKDRPGVLGFEPFNEPGWGSADESTFSATTLTAFYSAMVGHMRAAAPASLVFVDPPGVDGTNVSTTLGKPAGTGIVFAPHYYPIAPASADPGTDLAVWQGIGKTWDVPVFLGEFGAQPEKTTSAPYVSAVFDALDALSLNGSEWEYSIAAEEWNSESFSLVGADGGENSLAAAARRPYARAIAGSGITQKYDATKRTFTLSFTPAAGSAGTDSGGGASDAGTSVVTEVALPALVYPAGYAVSLTGACLDSTSAPGRLLLQPAGGATSVSLTITPK